MKEEDIPRRLEMVAESIAALRAVTIDGERAVKLITLVVWTDERNYPGQVDCGLLAPALHEEYRGQKDIHVLEITRGDIFCAALNRAVSTQRQKGCSHSLIVSPETNSYLSSPNVAVMVQALRKGALATGLAINELQESIMQGRLANTCMMWDIAELQAVGGFDLAAQKPRPSDPTQLHARGEKDGKEFFYALGGVEEIIPLIRLIKFNGACIAPIMPSTGAEEQLYQLPTDPELLKRHFSKMGTKKERQAHFAMREMCDLSYIKTGIMRDYRDPRFLGS